MIFRKDIYTEEYFRNLGLNERQIKAMMYVEERGRIANKDYQEINGTKGRLATLELNGLVNKGVLEKYGTTGRGTYYAVAKAQKSRLSRRQ